MSARIASGKLVAIVHAAITVVTRVSKLAVPRALSMHGPIPLFIIQLKHRLQYRLPHRLAAKITDVPHFFCSHSSVNRCFNTVLLDHQFGGLPDRRVGQSLGSDRQLPILGEVQSVLRS
jgi:hypothetical protein